MADDNVPIEHAASGTECLLFHDSLPPEQGSDPARVRGSVVFSEPERVISCGSGANLNAAFSAMDRALDQGYYVAGGFTYELGYELEQRLRPLAPEMDAPLFEVGVFGKMTRLQADEAEDFIEARAHTGGLEPMSGTLRYGLDQASYRAALARLHDYILAGDIYQANFTFPVSFPWSGNVWQLYKAVAPYQKVAFGAVLDLPAYKAASLSPELFFRMSGYMSGSVIESRPMKGTMRRGKTTDEDDALRWRLKADPKNRAENLMIVDLVRNDLGRMARTGGVSVENLFQVETYGTLHQMVSTVRAEVEGRPGVADIFRHLFPCGSVTGAPKIRAMEIISELESQPRGLYTGAIGYLTPDRDITMSVPIRTMVMAGHGTVRMGIGSGVVADSGAEDEYQECLLKAQFLRDALHPDVHRHESGHEPPGLIETMRSEGGEIPLLARHKSRLAASAAYLGIHADFTELWQEVTDCAASGAGWQRLRLELAAHGKWTVTSTPLVDIRAGIQGKRPPLVLVSQERLRSDDPLLAHKTTRRGLYEKARQMLSGVENAFDVLLFNERGELCEGAICNVFLERDGKLLTPAPDAGLLPGIMRAKIIAERHVTEQVLYEKDLREADRILVTNAVQGMIEVVLVD